LCSQKFLMFLYPMWPVQKKKFIFKEDHFKFLNIKYYVVKDCSKHRKMFIYSSFRICSQSQNTWHIINFKTHCILASDQEEPVVLILSVAYFYIAYVCGLNGVGSRIARGRVASIMQMGQFSCSMGLEWTGVHICASKPTISNKGFGIKERQIHTHLIVVICTKQCIIFSSAS
jgi:hypothetical protein